MLDLSDINGTSELQKPNRQVFNLLKTLHYVRNQSVPRSKHFPPRL